MKAHLRKRPVPLRNPMHLFEILYNMWNSLPDSYFESIAVSMPNHVDMVPK